MTYTSMIVETDFCEHVVHMCDVTPTLLMFVKTTHHMLVQVHLPKSCCMIQAPLSLCASGAGMHSISVHTHTCLDCAYVALCKLCILFHLALWKPHDVALCKLCIMYHYSG
jgi:hypothetical protein